MFQVKRFGFLTICSYIHDAFHVFGKNKIYLGKDDLIISLVSEMTKDMRNHKLTTVSKISNSWSCFNCKVYWSSFKKVKNFSSNLYHVLCCWNGAVWRLLFFSTFIFKKNFLYFQVHPTHPKESVWNNEYHQCSPFVTLLISLKISHCFVTDYSGLLHIVSKYVKSFF